MEWVYIRALQKSPISSVLDAKIALMDDDHIDHLRAFREWLLPEMRAMLAESQKHFAWLRDRMDKTEEQHRELQELLSAANSR